MDTLKPNQTLLPLPELLHSAPVGVVAVDESGTILFGNERLEQLFGYTEEELIGQPIEILLPLLRRSAHRRHRSRYLEAPALHSVQSGLDLTALHKNGKVFPVEIGLSVLQHQDHQLVLASVVDISVRKQMEATLERRVNERTHDLERRRQISDGLFNVLAMINANRPLDEILDSTLRQASRVLGVAACAIHRRIVPENQLVPQVTRNLPEEAAIFTNRETLPGERTVFKRLFSEREAIAVPDLAVAPNRSDAIFAQQRERAAASGLRSLLITPVIVRHDVYGVLSLFHAQPHEFNDEEIGLAWILSEQVALAIENARLHAELEEAAVTAERSRIAHDLHDSVTQTLFSASIIADILPRLWARRPEEGVRRLQELRELTRGALAEMRTLLLELRPDTLSTTMLSELIVQLGAAFIGRSRIPLRLQIDEIFDLPDNVRIAFYRIAQESLNNIAKHAEATEASLSLHCEDHHLKLMIADNGVGFDPAAVKGNHLGLNIMSERAQEIHALLEIKSQPGKGTTVCVCWHSKTEEGK
ncbi:MAG: PAS domain S-box protein [Caldilineaceae bacterium]